MVSLAPPLDARAAPIARRLPIAAIPALAGLIAFAVVLFAPQVLNDGDSWWHVTAGAWMLDDRRVLTTDVFSYTFAGRPWHTHEWLAEVLMGLASRAAGWSGVVLLYAVAAGATLAILGRRLSLSLPPLSLALVLLLAFGCMSPGLLARPHLFGLPLLAAWTAGLLQARDENCAPPLALALLMVPWANLHGGYAFGLALAGPFALEALVAAEPARRLTVVRDWGLFGAAALAATLVTPFGVSGLLFPFQLLGLKSLAGVAEWAPMDFTRVGPTEIALVAALFVMLQRGVRIPPLRLAVILLLTHMSLHHARHQLLLAVVAPMLLAEPLAQALDARAQARPGGRAWVAAALAGAVLLSLVRLAVPLVRVDGPSAPIGALAHVPADLRARPVFNDYGMGGYLIAQHVRPFIDGRTDMYGDAFTNAYFKAERPDPAELDKLFARWDIAWSILAPTDPVVALLDRRPGWKRLYADRWAVVHVRDAD